MFFLLKSWASIASNKGSHPLIFLPTEAPIYVLAGSRYGEQDEDFLDNFLKLCDVSGERLKKHMAELRDSWRKSVRKKKGLLFKAEELVLGKKSLTKYLDWSIDRNNYIDQYEYPVLYKPVVHLVSASRFQFEYDSDFDAFTLPFGQEMLLLSEASKCDILLLGDHDSDNVTRSTHDMVCVTKAMCTAKVALKKVALVRAAHLRGEHRNWVGSTQQLKITEVEYKMCYRPSERRQKHPVKPTSALVR